MPVLLSPHRILTDYIILEILHIDRENKKNNAVLPLDNTGLRKLYPGLPKNALDLFTWFTCEGIRFTRQEIKKAYERGQSDEPFAAYAEKAIIRKLHELFTRLKPFNPMMKWYHRVKTGSATFRTAPCAFSAYRPELFFEVVREGEKLFIESFVSVNGASYSIGDFARYHFLLESRNEYFLLSFRDYRTLEWLRDCNPEQYAGVPEELASKVLAVLETDYPVNRNNHFVTHRVETAPQQRVMLSEISNAFLVLTPQWVYEGFLQEYPWVSSVEVVRDGEVYTIVRDKNAEEEFLQSLEQLHPNFSRQLNGYFYLSFADAQKKQWFLKVYHRLLDQDVEVVGMDMLQHFRYSPHRVSTEMEIVETRKSNLRVRLTVSFGKEEVTPSELRKTLLAGQRAVLLKDGSLGVLGEEWIGAYGMLLKHSRVDGHLLLVPRWLAITASSEKSGERQLSGVLKKEWWQKWHSWQHEDRHLYSLPDGVVVEQLRPYQRKGYEWLQLLAEAGGGACLADDMGLGKTLQAICFLVSRLESRPGARHLVVCPSSLIYNWLGEWQKFAPGITCRVYHGAGRSHETLQDEHIRVIIVSYGMLRSDISPIADLSFDTVVVDESHNIKNPAALITQAVNQVPALVRVALSGTPVMNNTFDLFSQLSFLLPEMFGSREFFKREYADPIDRYRDEEKIKALRKLTAPFILRRTKEQVATDLPEKTENVLWCEMGPDQRFAYESIKENIRSSLFLEIKQNGFSSGKLSVLHGIMKLRQVCNSCELVEQEDLFSYESVKTQILIEELLNITVAHKVLVFSQFTRMLDLLERDLSRQGLVYCRLDGQTATAKRQELVDHFNSEGGEEKIFLISLKAGNAGLNLTAADYVFLFDPWWNTAVEQQAIDRTHRIGQTKNVFAYKMVCRGTIEEKIIQLQQRKSKISKELIGGEDGFVKTLTEEDVAFLFE